MSFSGLQTMWQDPKKLTMFLKVNIPLSCWLKIPSYILQYHCSNNLQLCSQKYLWVGYFVLYKTTIGKEPSDYWVTTNSSVRRGVLTWVAGSSAARRSREPGTLAGTQVAPACWPTAADWLLASPGSPRQGYVLCFRTLQTWTLALHTC